MSAQTKLISYQDSLTMPENRLEEIVHGESRIMPPATTFHGYLIQTLFMAVMAQLDPREYYGHIAGFGLGIERDPLTYRIPDIAFYTKRALRQSQESRERIDPYIWAVPELIVECLSPSNRKGAVQDLLADYARIAVPEAWILKPERRQCESYRYESGAMRHWQTLETGIVTPQRLPNVTIDLAELWTAFEQGAFAL